MRGRVGQRAFEPVTRLDADGVILHEHEQDGAVVELLAADAPGLGGADGEILEGGEGSSGKMATTIWLEV